MQQCDKRDSDCRCYLKRAQGVSEDQCLFGRERRTEIPGCIAITSMRPHAVRIKPWNRSTIFSNDSQHMSLHLRLTATGLRSQNARDIATTTMRSQLLLRSSSRR